MQYNYKPLADKLLVIENEKPKETTSGIYVGEANMNSDTRAGTVLAVGPDVKEVKVGDIVYPLWTKAKVVKDGELFLGILAEEDIVAILDQE